MYEIPLLNTIQKLFKQQHIDAIDHLNFCLTPMILSFFALFASAKQILNKPIQCWMPMEFKHGWEMYVENMCFVKNTYKTPEIFNMDIVLGLPLEKEYITYYQWVPIFMTLQCIMFYLPNYLWNSIKDNIFGLDIFFSDVYYIRSLPIKEQQLALKNFAKKYKHRLPGKCILLTLSYISIKLLCLLNLLAQFYILAWFLGTEYYLWGVNVLNSLQNDNKWEESSLFPRVTLCDFNIKQLGNQHHHTIQCVLLLNMFNEKMYLFIWYWFFVLMICTLLNTSYIIFNILLEYARQIIFKDYNKRITRDEYFVIKMIEQKYGKIFAMEILLEIQSSELKNV